MIIAPSLRTLYADLLQQLQNEGEIAATVYVQRKGGQSFYYARQLTGIVRRDMYLGPAEDAATQARVAEIREERALSKQRRAMVSALKRAGFPSPAAEFTAVLSALATAGLLSTCVLVGTGAYQSYSALLGEMLPASAMMTQDADLATAELAITANDGMPMLEILRRADASFRAVPGLSKLAPPSSFRSAAGFRVDLLTPVLRRSDTNPMPLPHIAAGATPLQYLGWLISEPAHAAVLARSGMLVRVPQPAKFAIHKLILAQRRSAPERMKRAKDLVQAKSLLDVLQRADPAALRDTLAEAKAKGGDGWRKPINRSLEEIGVTFK